MLYGVDMALAVPHNVEWVPEDSFPIRLAALRAALGGWNIKRAALHCGIKPENWRRWESGVSPHNMEEQAHKIAKATGCSYRWLLSGGPLGDYKFSLLMRPDLRLVPDPVEPLQCELFDTP